jgi:Uma2 family endonuclease
MSEAAHWHEDEFAEDYPESDGQPLAETEMHLDELLALRDVLKDHFRDAGDVYVGANMFVYYEKGVKSAVFAPDVFVTRGVPTTVRRTYKLWEEGRPPSIVVEISSDSTWLEDTGNKKALCARLGVSEYFLFDPLGDYLEPRLQGFELHDGDYARIAPRSDGSVESRVLGLVLSAEETQLRCIDPRTGERLLRSEEARQLGREARREAELAREQSAQLAAEVERLRAELAGRET